MINFLKTMPLTEPQPKVIICSTAGSGRAGHNAMPLINRIFYTLCLTPPHEHKLAMGRVVAQAAGRTWPKDELAIRKDILPDGWEKELREAVFF